MKTTLLPVSVLRLLSVVSLMAVGIAGAVSNLSGQPVVDQSVQANVNAAAWLQMAQSAQSKTEFDQATTNFVMALQQQYPLQAWQRSITVGQFKVTFQNMGNKGGTWGVSFFDKLLPSASVVSRKVRTQVVTTGAGVAFVGMRLPTAERIADDPNFPPETGMYCPVTVDLRFINPGTTGVPEVVVQIHNSMDSSLQLSADFTAPLELMIQHAMNPGFVRKAMLNPEEFGFITGLYMMEPYNPGKIPLVLVHGLDSSPRTWENVYNELMLDPIVRQRYQFLIYRYPTGNPILQSAARLRNSLLALQQRYDPKGKNQAFNQMVVIGHSMGGLLSRLMVTDSDNAFWNSRFDTPFDQTPLSESDRASLSNALFFRPLPFIKRVVFISTPHRGSALADSLPARMVNKFIKVPGIAAVQQTLTGLGTQVSGGAIALVNSNGITNLSPENPFIITLETRPLYAPFHTIVGNQGVMFRNTPGSDGIVPYESSHLDGAQSELVVPDTHSAHQDPRSIREIDRILRAHLR